MKCLRQKPVIVVLSFFLGLLCTVPICASETAAGQQPLKHRWFFSFGHARNRQGADAIKSLVDVGAEHGLNGMVLSSFGLDSITRWQETDVALLREVQTYCSKAHVELIPTGFSAGYGGGALGHNRNFAAALPVSLSLVAKNNRLVPAPRDNLLKNGDLETHANGRFAGFGFHDQPGEITFVDTDCVASGKTSIRFENLMANEHGHGRINQKILVQPGRSYRFSLKIKAQDLQPAGNVRMQILKENGSGTLASYSPTLKSTQDWTEVSFEFLNYQETTLLMYAGIWGGQSGQFWLDGMTLRENNTLSDIVTRQGTPRSLKSLDRTRTFVEGRDFQSIRNLRSLDSVKLLPGTTINNGERLELACYKIPSISHAWGQQISLCMSNPDLYTYWESQARRLHQVIKYKKILLSMDEIRNGGGCQTCQHSGLSMAEILGDCVTRLHGIFKRIDPDIEVMIWSDMLDPAHNAHNNYYGVVGDFTGAWQYVPKDLTLMCWYHTIRDKSLTFFSDRGFETFGAAYYDADDLNSSKDWLVSLARTPNARGIMYTTWLKKYALMADFGDLAVSR
ncbi:MAG: carbohydrate binding domain-containing protein [Phycisphaeraceae bacterium]|nr:carbohydrate binding domain-containing protein [Phycisphaeraceae bacterium]